MENKDTKTPQAAALPAEEAAAPAAPDGEEAARAFIRADAQAFRKAYPGVDLRELDADPLFRLFCGSRYGVEPLAELYGDFLALLEQAGERLRRADSRRERATGSGGSGGYDALTAAEQKELSQWNRTYPHLKMTAKEYKER